MNSDFVFGSQHDSHECMIWLLNKIQNEVVIEVENKIDYYSSNNYDFQNHGVGTSRYICTLRHEIKCMNRNCDFIQTSLEPCLSVSLSVPSPRKININFISLYPKREMTCFSCQIFDNSLTVKNLKDQIMNEVKNVSSKNMIAYLFKPTGLSQFLKDDSFIDKKFNELAIFEIPEQSNLPPNYISSIVIFVIGDFPNGKIIRIPFVASLNDALNYRQLCFELLKEGNFLLPRPYYKMTQNFKIILQTSDNSGIKGSIYNQSLPESEHGNILRIIVEWDLSLKAEFENMNYNLINRNKSFNNHFDLKPIPLINLIDNFVKIEPIENWECDKCGKESGYIKICFDSMPDILVFYLKRFATVIFFNLIIQIKNDRNVAIPFEGLNLDKYVFKGFNNIYNLTGHYTSANKNCVDHQWRLFNDLSVSSLNATNNITISSNSYMLFYQKQTSFPWFPENIPKNIIEYYFDEVKPHNQNNNRSGKNDGRTNNGSKDGITSYRRRNNLNFEIKILSWLLGCLLRLLQHLNKSKIFGIFPPFFNQNTPAFKYSINSFIELKSSTAINAFEGISIPLKTDLLNTIGTVSDLNEFQNFSVT
ncbi:Ubiquitin carboxyl-terminal hydrolase [Meloidogyne graminicola]|uniref:ubiquitinyl hydrolase 1 n=1 Tax=Meloidogyne graminicola TaxID=189291 RepID=A0A8S9ZUA9_9BILA|nr:Ubiquitin carboxyl-terminal hydrolase [Meloidogyne graminicola]